MSVHVMADVWERSKAGGTELLVLLKLADNADGDTRIAWPSVEYLARHCRISRRTVQRALRSLEESGEIVAMADSRPGHTTRYLVMVGGRHSDAGADSPPASPVARGGATDDALTVKEPPSSSSTPNGAEELTGIEHMIQTVWDHYTLAFGSRYVLTPARRKVIREAVTVRSVSECCDAVVGLLKSAYHREHGYTDITYALRGGGKNPQPDATIDRMGRIGRGEIDGRGASDRATTLSKEHYDHARRLEAAGR